MPTGFVDLDEMTRGLQAGDLVIVAARPSMGKTSLVLNIAQYVAAQPDHDGRASSAWKCRRSRSSCAC